VVPERIMNEIQNLTDIKRNKRRRLFDLPSDVTQNIEINTLLKSELDAIPEISQSYADERPKSIVEIVNEPPTFADFINN
jgi:hypothetical protein